MLEDKACPTQTLVIPMQIASLSSQNRIEQTCGKCFGRRDVGELGRKTGTANQLLESALDVYKRQAQQPRGVGLARNLVAFAILHREQALSLIHIYRIRKRPRAFAARGARSRKLASLRPGAMRKKGFRCIQSPAQNFRIRWFLAMGRALFCRRVGIVAVRIPLYPKRSCQQSCNSRRSSEVRRPSSPCSRTRPSQLRLS